MLISPRTWFPNPASLLKTKRKLLRALLMPTWSNLTPGSPRKTSRNKRGGTKDPLNAKLLRSILDGEFELVPFEDNSSKNFKIGKDLPNLVKAQLIACLRENAYLFAWSATDMPGIDPSVACHQLTVDPGVSVVAQ
jgi:hypothetical protein